ncbi:MAG: cell filamentation protein Fic [Betaproteobacteria bacterium HGW-Betaproteobacteria-18]|nr:MAG: cell filamentation protein Fic [Betaproteobacteria bacterium HGW-Betaproteobacteria-18]
MELQYATGATPLDPDEAAGLIPRHITTQAELNEWEQTNILEGAQWAFKQKNSDLLDEYFVRELHRRMFSKTWKWSGSFRLTDKNIGVDWQQIPVQLRNLFDDVKAQIEFKAYPPDELALRFHHRLVWIHPFANDNGRHARLMADLLIARLGVSPLSWGGQSLVGASEKRAAYLAALKAADARDYQRLMQFARSQ